MELEVVPYFLGKELGFRAWKGTLIMTAFHGEEVGDHSGACRDSR
jgi:hypothetical protein